MIEKLESRQAPLRKQIEDLDGRIVKLRQQLSALDQTFLLHEIQVDPTELRSTRPHQNRRLVPHGQMTRQILRILRSHDGWVSTSQIARKIAEQLVTTEADVDDETLMYIHVAVRRRLRAMVRSGNLQRIEGVRKGRCYDDSNQSLWRLSELQLSNSGDEVTEVIG
jgi:hypothetical protein